MAEKGKSQNKNLLYRRVAEDEAVRNAQYILYPDHIIVPEGKDGEPMCDPYYALCNWLDAQGVKAVLSPLHNMDLYDVEDVKQWRNRYLYKNRTATYEDAIADSPNVGDRKEPHYHLDVYLPGQQKLQWWLDFILPIYGEYPEWRVWKVRDPEASKKYMSHKCSPTKARYKDNEVMAFGGADLSCLWHTDEVEKLYALKDVRDMILEKKIVRYKQLLDFAISTGEASLIRCVQGQKSVWSEYLSDVRYEQSLKKKRTCRTNDEGPVEEMLG